jgi:hypothetical protein
METTPKRPDEKGPTYVFDRAADEALARKLTPLAQRAARLRKAEADGARATEG